MTRSTIACESGRNEVAGRERNRWRGWSRRLPGALPRHRRRHRLLPNVLPLVQHRASPWRDRDAHPGRRPSSSNPERAGPARADPSSRLDPSSRTLRSRDPTTRSPSPSRLDQPARDIHNRRHCSVNRNRQCLKVVDRFRFALCISSISILRHRGFRPNTLRSNRCGRSSSGRLHDERDRESDQRGAPGGAYAGPLPERQGRAEVDLPGTAGCGAEGAGTTASLARGANRVRDPLRRALRPGGVANAVRGVLRAAVSWGWAAGSSGPADTGKR